MYFKQIKVNWKDIILNELIISWAKVDLELFFEKQKWRL